MPVRTEPLSAFPVSNLEVLDLEDTVASANPGVNERYAIGQIVNTALGDLPRQPLPDGETFFIAPSGDDNTGSGTEGNPWKSLLHAGIEILNGYDFGFDAPKIKCLAGVYTDFDGFYGGWNAVGGGFLPQITIEGEDTSDPTQTIFDDSGHTNATLVNLPPGGTLNVFVHGIQCQNFNDRMLNNQSLCGVIWLGNTRWIGDGSSDLTWDNEAGGAITSGGVIIGGPPQISIGGAHAQLLFVGGSKVDFDNALVTFESGTTFSFAVFNVAVGGSLSWHDNNNGLGVNPTGRRFLISSGSHIVATEADFNTLLDETAMPGNIAGIINGGYFNNTSESMQQFAFADLPAPGIGDSARRRICTNANGTTFGSATVGGGGSVIPVYWDVAGGIWRNG